MKPPVTRDARTKIPVDHTHLQRAIDLSIRAAGNGNHPFGAVLVDESGRVVLEAENTVVDDHDETSHAELNLIRAANRILTREERAHMVLYSSAEPCPMCAAAMFWSGIRSLVFGLSQPGLYNITTKHRNSPEVLRMTCRRVLAAGTHAQTSIAGPLLTEQAAVPHLSYWPKRKRG